MAISLGRTEESAKRETKSPRPSMVQSRKSKPGPRLAMVVGAKVLTEANIGSSSSMWMGLEFKIDRLQLQHKELSFRVGEIRFNVEGS